MLFLQLHKTGIIYFLTICNTHLKIHGTLGFLFLYFNLFIVTYLWFPFYFCHFGNFIYFKCLIQVGFSNLFQLDYKIYFIIIFICLFLSSLPQIKILILLLYFFSSFRYIYIFIYIFFFLNLTFISPHDINWSFHFNSSFYYGFTHLFH